MMPCVSAGGSATVTDASGDDDVELAEVRKRMESTMFELRMISQQDAAR